MGVISDPSNISLPKSGGNFIKLAAGQNRFRILKVTQYSKGFKIQPDGSMIAYISDKGDHNAEREELLKMGCADNKETRITANWGMLVIDRQTGLPGILDVSQNQIKEPLLNLWKSADWGNLQEYDVVIEKRGQGPRGTRYNVLPQPKKPLTQEEITMVRESGIKLEDTFNPAVYNDKSRNQQDSNQAANDAFSAAQTQLGGTTIGGSGQTTTPAATPAEGDEIPF